MDVSALPRRNRLADETSPYLLQHADNPVDWRPWGPEAFADARALDKPILLSVGYAACHWCHVMAHESFDDLDTASIMNALFVNIKVDREERPDLDAVYQAALAASGQHGGWPLTMFLTPDGRPFFGGTYFPPEPRYGRPGFQDVLRGVAELYATERDRAYAQAATLTDAVKEMHAKNTDSVDATPHAVERVARLLTREIDPFLGGTAGAPKFPQVPLYDLLWRLYRRTNAAPFGQAVRVTLEHMVQGGIYDHVGGGFARYATDEAWLVPHFEKMLYDNALLVELMTHVWRLNRSPLLAQRVAETIEWLEREMTAELGAFAAALDADSEGEEGRFYVWTTSEIDRVLGKDAPVFKAAYGVTPGGNWEGHTILNRSHAPELKSPAEEATFARCREALLRWREKRPRPMRDDKILADWNGLMIAALAEAGGAFGRPEWVVLAKRAFEGIVEGMQREGKLTHAYRRGRAQPQAGLEDYAAMMKAALALHEVTGEARPLDLARGWAAYVDLRFSDADGGYRMTADDVDDLPVRPRAGQDHATPSGAGVMIANLARLRHLTGVAAYELRARSAVRAFAPTALRRPMGAASVLAGIELLEHPVQVVIAGDAHDPRALALIDIALAAPQPNRILLRSATPTALPAYHPAHGKGPVEGAPAAYVCRGPVCSAPVTTAMVLEAALADAPTSKSSK